MLLLISFMPFEKTQTNKIKSVGYTKTRSFLVLRKVRFLAMTMFEQARRCSFGLTKTFKKHALATSSNALFFVLLHKLSCVQLQEKQFFLFKSVAQGTT